MAEATGTGTGTGTVTSLSSVLMPEEAHKAARRVVDAISESWKEVERLKEFVADNAGLISLVQKLRSSPTSFTTISWRVPFGKAAFFPGRLIHTNEFMVMFGEGYYAQRTSKQTVEILRRRGKALDTNVECLKSMIEDLRAEALFFDSTATEVAEGLVEIREEIPDERDSSEIGSVEQGFQSISMSENAEASDEDDAYARLMSQLDELEKEEQAAAAVEGNDEGTDNHGCNEVSGQSIFHEMLKSESHSSETLSWSIDGHSKHGGSLTQKHPAPNMHKQLNLGDCTSRPIPEDAYLCANNSRQTLQSLSNQELILMQKETTTSVTSSNDQVPSQWLPPPQRADTSKAFTGSVIERAPNFQADHRDPSTASSQVPSSQPSKPVSRFKLQRR